MRIFLWALHIYKAQYPDKTIACLVAISLVLKRPNHLAGCQHQNEQKESGRPHAKNTADTDAYLCALAPRTPYQHCTDNIGVHARSGARIWRECLLSPLHTSRCGQSKRTYPAGETPEQDIYMRIFLWAVRIHYTHSLRHNNGAPGGSLARFEAPESFIWLSAPKKAKRGQKTSRQEYSR
jgi:hypothetical protein